MNSELIGLNIINIEGLSRFSEEVIFITTCGRQFKMYHYQDCCEHVYLVDFQVFKGYEGKVLEIIETTNKEDIAENGGDESYTWSFYEIITDVGKLKLRWFGSSNGYYSEDVELVEIF